MPSRPRPLLRPQFKRSRGGCLTCRLRKKKCNEVKPLCRGCERNKLACHWADSEPKRATSPASHESSSTPSHPSHTATYSPQSTTEQSFRDVIYTAAYQRDLDSPATTLWAARLGSFLSTNKPCALTPTSTLLLQHYLYATGNYLPMPMKENAFINEILPLACVDDLIMHTLLAVSGVHLGHKQRNNPDITTATLSHYAYIIRHLRTELGPSDLADFTKAARLLMALMMLCHFEVISGEIQGGLFIHLGASRQLVARLFRSSALELVSYDTRKQLGFALELYSYLIITNTVTPHGLVTYRALPNDVLPIKSLSPFKTFGIMFAGGHMLFELIPRVSVLFSQRLAEETAGASSPSAASLQEYDDIHRRLNDWVPDEADNPEEGLDETKHYLAMSHESLRHGIRIYLLAAIAGSVISDPDTLAIIQDSVKAIFAHGKMLRTSQWSANYLWSILMAGSCMRLETDQQSLLDALIHSRYHMGHTNRVIEVFQLLWANPDPRCFGPYGLYLTIKDHSPGFSMLWARVRTRLFSNKR